MCVRVRDNRFDVCAYQRACPHVRTTSASTLATWRRPRAGHLALPHLHLRHHLQLWCVCGGGVVVCHCVCVGVCVPQQRTHEPHTTSDEEESAHTHAHTPHTHACNTHAHAHLYDVSASPPPQLSLTPTTLVPLNHHQCDQTPQSFKPPPLFRTRARARVSKRRSRATIPDPGPRGPSPACPGALPATTTPVRSDPRRSGRSSLPTWQLQ